jgi:tetratricopeptide (TPR) repeat protein
VRGIGAIYKPRLFGGGLDRAAADLRKAIELFERDDPRPPAPAWGRGEAWIWLGQTLARQGDPAEARAAYVTALEYEPENAWLREVLLPALDSDR